MIIPQSPIPQRTALPGDTSMTAGSFLRDIPMRFRRRMSGGTYRPEIDGLRFLAIATVLVGHFMERAVRFFPAVRDAVDSSPFGGLVLRPGLGVYLFFAVSGFIIATQARKSPHSPLNRRFLGAYFGRRILRIEPPYVVLLVGTWLLISVTGYSPEGTKQFWTEPHSLGVSLLASIFYIHDLVWGTYPRLFPPGWSLEVEVQFYLVAPLLFWLWFKARDPRLRIACGGLALVIGSLVSLVAPPTIGPLFTDASILRFIEFFWLGIVLADLRDWLGATMSRLPSIVAGMIGWLGLLAYLTLPQQPDTLASEFVTRMAVLAAVAAMFASAFAARSSFRSFCARPWISLIGGACYSIYLTHLQVIQATTSVIARIVPGVGMGSLMAVAIVEGVIVLVVGLTFYALIERTFMIPDWPRRAWQAVRGSSPRETVSPAE